MRSSSIWILTIIIIAVVIYMNIGRESIVSNSINAGKSFSTEGEKVSELNKSSNNDPLAGIGESGSNQKEKGEKNIEYSILTIANVMYKNNKVIVKGESDLPDNSILEVNFIPKGAIASKENTITSNVSVEKGKYSLAIKVPEDNPALYKGPYKVEVKFLLDLQTSVKVSNLIGDGAKRLTGKLVVLVPISEYKSLEISVLKKLFALELRAYSVVDAKKYHTEETKYMLACFFKEWNLQNWDTMLKYTYKPWVKGKKNAVLALKSLFGTKKLVGADVLGIVVENPLMAEVNFKIYYVDREFQKKKIECVDGAAKVIQDNDGGWGVFPESIIKKDAIYKIKK